MSPSELAKTMAAFRPLKLRVVLNDETEKPVAMPRGRQRWQRASQAIDDLPWATVYLLDGQGAILKTIQRDDTAPAGDLEHVDAEHKRNPTMAVVHACMGAMAPALRDVHKVAAQTTLELVTKVRAIHKDELKDIIAGYTALLEKTLERNVAFEERSNQLMAENDSLRDELAALRTAAKPDENDWRERAILGKLGFPTGPENANAPEGEKSGNGNGVSGG